MNELKEKIATELVAHAEFSTRGRTMNFAYAVEAAGSVLDVIEKAGYVVLPKEAIEKMVREHDAERTDLTSRLFTALGATFVPSSPSYFDRADSATSFDPEKQFEKVNGL